MGNGIPPVVLISEDMSKKGEGGGKTHGNQEEQPGPKQKPTEDSNFGGLKPQRREHKQN